MSPTYTPPRSPRSRASSRSNLSLDLSDLPPLITPSPPSNTLLVTNLNDPTIFASQTIEHLQNLITNALSTAAQSDTPQESDITTEDRLHTFSPLPSMRRAVLIFTTTAAAIYVRGILDGSALASGDRVRVYFGAETPLEKLDLAQQRLQAPKAQKQFFISPPPSPPAGWTMRNEDPPNKDVHATDLATALEHIGRKLNVSTDSDAMDVDVPVDYEPRQVRSRADSRTIVFEPKEQGHSPDLPAIAVEDTTDSPVELAPEADVGAKMITHTARPPVELMSS